MTSNTLKGTRCKTCGYYVGSSNHIKMCEPSEDEKPIALPGGTWCNKCKKELCNCKQQKGCGNPFQNMWDLTDGFTCGKQGKLCPECSQRDDTGSPSNQSPLRNQDERKVPKGDIQSLHVKLKQNSTGHGDTPEETTLKPSGTQTLSDDIFYVCNEKWIHVKRVKTFIKQVEELDQSGDKMDTHMIIKKSDFYKLTGRNLI